MAKGLVHDGQQSDRSPTFGSEALKSKSRGGSRTSDTRGLALEVLGRIERDGAYANLALRAALDRSELDRRNRAFVTSLVYGTTRMRRACDHLVDRFLHDEVQPEVRTVLRLGAWQLVFGEVPPHAAVSATVAVAPRRVQGLCNAVLRRVADELQTGTPPWPSQAVALSCPDELLERLVADLGREDAVAAMEAMNRPAIAVAREDGYYQDQASQLVVEAVLAPQSRIAQGHPGERILDVCSAPGGKATALAASGARVVACDLRERRLGLVASNACRLAIPLLLVAADGRASPFPPQSFDRVLVDAPCSGLGVLRRRADARWQEGRTSEATIAGLADLQFTMLSAAVRSVAPGGILAYSVCTMTVAETVDVDRRLRAAHPTLIPGVVGKPWRPLGDHASGGLLLPQDLDSEGMAVFIYRVV
ncbi:MAG: transcription antitermination factor NusB [Acidimicrobiales bacterium]|nr:transcription antitermination factor NusB [Acidimicrobiales bacterium]